MLSSRLLSTFTKLLAEAKNANDPEPTAMTLATSDGNGRISARVVLLKGVDERGFRFFTNYQSDKGQQINAHPGVALTFLWKTLANQVQVRVEGKAYHLPNAESDAYFATRARNSQLGAWASLQSRELPDQSTFEKRIAHFEQAFENRPVPRPSHWGGILVIPDQIEFWYGAKYRWHKRVNWRRKGQIWYPGHLYP